MGPQRMYAIEFLFFNYGTIYVENIFQFQFQKELAHDLRSFECENRCKGQCKIKVDVMGDT